MPQAGGRTARHWAAPAREAACEVGPRAPMRGAGGWQEAREAAGARSDKRVSEACAAVPKPTRRVCGSPPCKGDAAQPLARRPSEGPVGGLRGGEPSVVGEHLRGRGGGYSAVPAPMMMLMVAMVVWFLVLFYIPVLFPSLGFMTTAATATVTDPRGATKRKQ